jgi:bis(5'-nucleosyl)-tetraphosphatase (symmetrical)
LAAVQPIFVGDVQGCADEFAELLARARTAFGERFELWLVGDLVNRGPRNLELLETVAELVDRGRARYVLGNHEIGLLMTALGLRPVRPTDTFVDVLDAPELSFWVEWLRRRPLVETGALEARSSEGPGARRFAVVHAAVHPDWDLAELEKRARSVEERLGGRPVEDAAKLLRAPRTDDADRDVLDRLTRCRSVDGRGGWSDEEPEIARGQAWHAAWSERPHDYGVVYGHWSIQGLHVAPRLRGLDTGCVHHGRSGPRALTAWLPDRRAAADPFAVPDDRFWRIPAKRRYAPAGAGSW